MLKLASYSVRQIPLLTIALAKLPHLPNSPLPGKPTESTEKSAVLGLSHFRRQISADKEVSVCKEVARLLNTGRKRGTACKPASF